MSTPFTRGPGRQRIHATLTILLVFLNLCGIEASWAKSRPLDVIATRAREIQSDWARVFYEAPRETQGTQYGKLLERIRELKQENPTRAEPLIVEAIILCTYSAASLGLDTIDLLETARDLLKESIRMDPHALEGGAYVTLGNLYRRLPGWPILYGDRKLAKEYLSTGARLFPEGIDTNYFMGDFLLEEGDLSLAIPYLEKAQAAPLRPSLRISDEHVHLEAADALVEARAGRHRASDFFSLFTPSFR